MGDPFTDYVNETEKYGSVYEKYLSKISINKKDID